MILIVTGNRRMREEIQEALAGKLEYEFLDVHLEEVQGEVLDVAEKKARAAYAKTCEKSGGRPVVVEDYSVEIEALGGMPGPYMKQFLSAIPKVIQTLKQATETVRARVRCVYAYFDETDVRFFEGDVQGRLEPWSAEGSRGKSVFLEPCSYNVSAAVHVMVAKTQRRTAAIRKLACRHRARVRVCVAAETYMVVYSSGEEALEQMREEGAEQWQFVLSRDSAAVPRKRMEVRRFGDRAALISYFMHLALPHSFLAELAPSVVHLEGGK